MEFQEVKTKFEECRSTEDGMKIMNKVAEIINDIGANFLEMDGGMLSEHQVKLSGYKFYLADYMAELNRGFEGLSLEIKQTRAENWDTITEEIKARDGKVKNKEQIENEIHKIISSKQYEAMLYETMYYKFKLKISSIDSMLMALNQRIAELRRQLGQV